MTHRDFEILLKHPETLTGGSVPQLKELIEHYPYFIPARMLYLRALKQSGDMLFDKELERTALYAHDRRWLYYFIYPERETGRKQKYVRPSTSSGDYFDMLQSVEQEGGNVSRSLKVLAERLKQARINVIGSSGNAIAKPVERPEKKEKPAIWQPPMRKETNWAAENYGEKIKRLIRERKYGEALAILEELNLNNPKKSIYFADQIRFIEKIIDNTKK